MTDEKIHKILVVDDNDMIRETYLQIFRQKGFDATGAKDGVEGIDLATKEKYDVIMTGIIMPRMDGFKLISTLRENVNTKDIPVAIISHLGREEDRQKAAEMGIGTFIVQGSMTPREVADKMKSLLTKSSSYQIGLDYASWDAPLLEKILKIPNFECPSCKNKMILELTQKTEGKGFDAFFKCPKCDLNL